jgi:hypothetical protein
VFHSGCANAKVGDMDESKTSLAQVLPHPSHFLWQVLVECHNQGLLLAGSLACYTLPSLVSINSGSLATTIVVPLGLEIAAVILLPAACSRPPTSSKGISAWHFRM